MRVGWTVVGATTAGLLLSALSAVPAYAAPPPDPTIGTPDTSTPGHVTGTITSPEGPYLSLRLGSATIPDATSDTPLVLAGESGPFDVPTWGRSGPVHLWVKACRAADSPAGDCTGFLRLDPAFTPTDVTPDVELSADTTVGPEDEIQVTAEDSGGGTLVATWSVPGAAPIHTVLDQHGTTNVNTGSASFNGSGTVEVRRCSTASATVCASFDPAITQAYTVKKRAVLTAAPIAPITVANPDGTVVALTTDARGPYALTWTVRNGIFPDAQGTVPADPEAPVAPDGALALLAIDGADLNEAPNPQAPYEFEAEITVQDPDYGTLTGTLDPERTFLVDRGTPVPGATTIVNRTIYPNVDEAPYPGSAKVTSSANFMEFSSYAIRNSGGTLVRQIPRAPGNLQSGIWNGKTAGGVLVPAGTYRVHARDDVGNESSSVGTITVSHGRWVTKTWTRKVRARTSTIDTYVGRCSALNSPGTRGWAASVGYYANVRCANRGRNVSTAATLNAVNLIKAPRYLSVRVRAYGGPSRRSAGSVAYLRYVKVQGGVSHQVKLRPRLRSHDGALLTGPNAYIRASDRRFRWNVYTFAGSRYDVRDFTVVVRYQTVG